MLSEKVVKLLSKQINKESFSAYLYLDISNYYKDKGLDGSSDWYQIQAQREHDHVMLILQYMQNDDEKVALETIAKPDMKFSNLIGSTKTALAHERYVTNSIHAVYEEAYNMKDFHTMQFLDWSVKEQGEEKTNAEDIIKKIELFGSDSRGLYLLDREPADRVYVTPGLVL